MPPKTRMVGNYCVLEPINLERHAAKLYDLFCADKSGWTYLPYGPFDSYDENQPSRNAAERLGFKLEGIFRQHIVYKNRNRDTAWYSIIDSEWPQLKSRFQKRLDTNNFDRMGKQILSLMEC